MIDISSQTNYFEFNGGIMPLFAEYGHRIPSKFSIRSYDELVAYSEQDMTLRSTPLHDDFIDFPSMVGSQNIVIGYISIHNLLRQHGEFHGWMQLNMGNWMVIGSDFAHDNAPQADDLRFAFIYGVEDWQSKRIAMMVMRSRRRDWFLSCLSNFGLSIDAIDYPGHPAVKPALLRAIYYNDDSLIPFLLQECNANVNVIDNDMHQTALMLVCSRDPPRLLAVQCLLDLGADVNAVDKNGWTAMDYAVHRAKDRGFSRYYHASWYVILILLRAGAEFGQETRYTFAKLLDMVRNNNDSANTREELVQMLEMKVSKQN